MTIDELQSFVRILSNQGWVRWWANLDNRRENVRMAIQVLDICPDGTFRPVRVLGLEEKGLQELDDNKVEAKWLYTINRTNPNGTPFVSQIL